MGTVSPSSVFGDTPDGPLFYAKSLLAFMTSAWLAEDQFQRNAVADAQPTEFSALMPRVHADVLELVAGLIKTAEDLAVADRHG